MPPLFAIPTTAGTGSEVGRSALIILPESNHKSIFFHPKLIPDIAVLEPELTLGLPKDVTIATGIDALTHNLEAYLASGFHPMADGIALEGINLILQYLPRVVENGQDIEARGKMLLAATMGATAFQKGLGMTHSLSHPLSTRFDMHHGLANALLLPEVLVFLECADLNRGNRHKLEEVSRLFQTSEFSKNRLSMTIGTFIRTLGITLGLRAYGIEEQHLEELSELAFEDPCHQTNLVPVTQKDLYQVYLAAL